MAQAHAYLGTNEAFHTFRFNPDHVAWDYAENSVSHDTLGGRVVQLLSVRVNSINVLGVAGSRGELQRLSDNIKSIMGYHTRTQNSVDFKVPSRKWHFKVYVAAMPQVGWEVASTTYPYQLQLEVEQDLNGVQSRKLQVDALARLYQGIGYSPAFQGGNASEFNKIVESVLSASQFDNNPSGRGGSSSGSGEDGGFNPADVTGSNTGSITGRDTDALKTIERALLRNKMLRPGRTCGSDTIAGPGVSEHYYCNAKDLMVSSGTARGRQKADGDAIAGFLEHNLRRNTLPINCIIWYRRILSRSYLSQGWRPYSGVSPHVDHVHVSAVPSKGGGC